MGTVAMRQWTGVLVVVCALAGSTPGAQSYAAFGFKPAGNLAVPAFSDDELTGLLATLDRLVADAPIGNASDALWQFGRRLQTGALSAPQEARILARLETITRARADLIPAVKGARRVVQQFTVGKPAPEISGTDLGGRPFKLSDYRGQVVALVFSAEWCAICKTQAPYERFLMGRYERWPFALLTVQTGSSREAAHAASMTDHLAHRTWWDEPADGDKGGPIAEAWNVIGWPATYVIDGTGVIRFVNVRDEDLLKAVRQLVDEQVNLDAKARRPK
jgi:peroxiredoxin